MNSEKPEILMVDDDEITLDVMKAFLKKGYNLETVTKLQEAMTKIHAKRYDVILLDINLGKGITGFALINELKSMPEYQGVPIIAVTAFAMPGDKEYFLKAGCTDYISKPFAKQDIITIIEKALR
ncbi:MAG: Polar-differentiation response regulator DivK [Ignavibacteriaceae bacterium]|nr:Polar-differentiation response regulator DivK [Ignavibacteriaceae bacterium]